MVGVYVNTMKTAFSISFDFELAFFQITSLRASKEKLSRKLLIDSFS